MGNYEKFLLLGTLSFFFGCMAFSLVFMHNKSVSDTSASYMYTPSLVEDGSFPQPVITQEAANAYASLPKGFLNYPVQLNVAQEMPCYSADAYSDEVKKRKAKLKAKGTVEQSHLEIYVNKEGDFSIFLIEGEAAAEPSKACILLSGKDWDID